MHEDLEISLDTSPSPEDVAVLSEGLTRHARSFVDQPGFRPIGVFARDGRGRIVGGAYGFLNWNWLAISFLWVASKRRGQGLGSKLLLGLEEAGRERGCTRAHLDTFSFQARAFYERHGYVAFAGLPDYPPGRERVFLRKELAAG